MKKVLLILIILFFASGVQAKNLRVLSLKSFSTAQPSPTFEVQTIHKECLTQGIILEPGTIISGSVLRVEPPKVGKRNGYFEFIPTEFTYNGQCERLDHANVIARVLGYNPVKPSDLALNVTKNAASFFFKSVNGFIKGAITSAIDFADGAIQAQDGQRLQSGMTKAYNDSLFSYIKPGEELIISTGDILTLKIKTIR